MTLQQQIETKLADLKPILASAGKGIELVECTEEKAIVKLSGFCDSCACSESYKEGMEDLIRMSCP